MLNHRTYHFANHEIWQHHKQSCRMMRERVSDPLLWREMCRARWPFVSIDRYKSWRTCFIAHTKIQRGWGTGKPGDFHVSTFRGHTSYITDFQLYRAILATASADRTARIWRANQSAVKSDTVCAIFFSASHSTINQLQKNVVWI